MFVDEIEIYLKGGDGGDGIVSFFPKARSGPDGGNGGDGGGLLVRSSNHITTLNSFVGKKIISAENGAKGGGNERFGADGKDLILDLPVGTVLKDLDSGEEIDLNEAGKTVLVCKGGFGGRGNAEFKSGSNTTPRFAEEGTPGQKRHFKIIIKLIANYGLIGLPNTGKSSLLNELTNANVKIADYPFTTLEPNLGAMGKYIIADIPGLIEGAHRGKGLGIKFLKHIEKVSLILQCIASDSEDVLRDYKTVIEELENFNPALLEKAQLILVTKSDLLAERKLNEKIKLLKKTGKKVLPVSIHDWESLEKLRKILL